MKKQSCFFIFGLLLVSCTVAGITPERREYLEARYVINAEGVVSDTETGLEWHAGPDRGINWYQAKSWVEQLSVAGGGWRMPTRKELRTLYQKDFGDPNRNVTPLLLMTGWYSWSGESHDSSSGWLFHFGYVNEGWRSKDYVHVDFRIFAVRSKISNI